VVSTGLPTSSLLGSCATDHEPPYYQAAELMNRWTITPSHHRAVVQSSW